MCVCVCGVCERERETERERDRQTDIDRQRERDRETEREYTREGESTANYLILTPSKARGSYQGKANFIKVRFKVHDTRRSLFYVQQDTD